jgi:D-alanyl-D-alanine carboxypeptidase (penicillin-binding protein 5/6)
VILKYALNNDTFKEIYTSIDYTTTNGLKFKRTLDKYANGLDVSLIKGDKTGHTDKAGYCLSSISTIDGVDYLVVTLGANTTKDFINDHVNLYNYFKDNYSYRNILNENQLLISIPVKDAKIDKYDVISNKEIKKYLSNDVNLDDIEYVYDGIDTIDKKIKLNDKLGTISIKYNGELLDTYDIYLNEKIKYKMELYLKILIIIIPILLILIIRKITKKNKKSIMKNL